MLKDQLETVETKRPSLLQLETFPTTAPNDIEHELIESADPPTMVSINPINASVDTPPRVNVKIPTDLNPTSSKAHTTKDRSHSPRVRFSPTTPQIKPLSDPSCMAHKENLNIHRLPTFPKTDRAANVAKLEQKQIN